MGEKRTPIKAKPITLAITAATVALSFLLGAVAVLATAYIRVNQTHLSYLRFFSEPVWFTITIFIMAIAGCINIFINTRRDSQDAATKRREKLIQEISNASASNLRDAIQQSLNEQVQGVDEEVLEEERAEKLTHDPLLEDQLGLTTALSPDYVLNKIISITFEYVEGYYRQTQDQAMKAFSLCKAAAIISLVIVAGGVLALFYGQVKPGAIVTGVGAFGELIAAVFFYLYNRTILKMSEYHQKLVLTQNVSLALKITELLPQPEKTKAQVDLIKSLSKDINKYLSPAPEKMDLTPSRAQRRTHWPQSG